MLRRAVLLLVAATACGRSSGDGAVGQVDSGGLDGTPSQDGPADAADDAAAQSTDGAADAVCGASLESELPPGSSAVSGSVTGGADLSATLCPGGASAYFERAPDYSSSPFFFELNYNTNVSNPAVDFTFESPQNALGGALNVALGIDSIGPGTLGSPAGSGDCGAITFLYSLPPSPSIDCDGGTATSCPEGCGRICPASGCSGIPCAPNTPSVSFTASGSTSACIGDAGSSPQGSWTLTLTSIADGGVGLGVPHGTLAATLVETDGATPGTASLSLSF
jgi:hypothetical protein